MITVRLDKEEEDILRNIVDAKNTTISVYVREVLNKAIEEEIDTELYKQAIKIIHDDNAEYVEWDDAMEVLGLTDEV